MKQKHSHTTYSAADIQKYLEGMLSVAEMHAIEKAALEDPMLADAIEGMEAGSADYREDMQWLKERIFQKKKRRIALAWSGAAAAVIVVATYGVLLLNRQKSVNKKGELATTTILPKHKKVTTDTIVSAEKATVSSSANQSDNPVSFGKKESFPDDMSPAQAPLLAEKETIDADSSRSVVAVPDTQKISDPLRALDGRVPGIAIERVYSKKDTILNPSIEVADDVVVSRGYYADKSLLKKRKVNNNEEEQSVNAEPIEGWKKYNRYLKKQKRKDPVDLLTNGTVIVRFDVGPKGNLSNFTIKQSLSSFYDQEAIRLIKEGPAWKLKQGEKASVVLSIDF